MVSRAGISRRTPRGNYQEGKSMLFTQEMSQYLTITLQGGGTSVENNANVTKMERQVLGVSYGDHSLCLTWQPFNFLLIKTFYRPCRHDQGPPCGPTAF